MCWQNRLPNEGGWTFHVFTGLTFIKLHRKAGIMAKQTNKKKITIASWHPKLHFRGYTYVLFVLIVHKSLLLKLQEDEVSLFDTGILASGKKKKKKKYASRLLHTAYLTDISHSSWLKNISLDYQVSLPKTNACLVNKALFGHRRLSYKADVTQYVSTHCLPEVYFLFIY